MSSAEKKYKMLSDEENEMMECLNKFRRDPTCLTKTLKVFILGVERLNPDSKIIDKYKDFKRSLKSQRPCPDLELNEDLCKMAKKYLEKKPEKETDGDFFILDKDEIKEDLPEEFSTLPKDRLCLVHSDYDRPEISTIKLNENIYDEEGKIKELLRDEDTTYVGLAIGEEKEDEDQHMVLILSGDPLEEPNPEDKNFKIEGVDLTELRLAFEAMDIKKKEKLNIREIVKEMAANDYEKVHPTIFKLMNELNDGRKYVTWPEFAKHFYEGLGDKKTEEGRKNIYDVFKPDSSSSELEFKDLKKINNYLKLNYTDKELRKMLKVTTNDKTGVAYDDYVDRLEGKYEPNKEEA